MTTMQLNVALQREMSYVVSDETLMQRVLTSIRKLRRERKAEISSAKTFDTDAEITENLRTAFQEYKHVLKGYAQTRNLEDVLNEL